MLAEDAAEVDHGQSGQKPIYFLLVTSFLSRDKPHTKIKKKKKKTWFPHLNIDTKKEKNSWYTEWDLISERERKKNKNKKRLLPRT